MSSFVVAVVGPPFGVKGRLRLKSLSGETGHLETLAEARLRLGADERRYKIEHISTTGQNLLVKFAGIDTPEAAAALRGAELLVERSSAATLASGEYYVEDLRGLKVVLDGQLIGVVTDIVDGGGGQLVELKLQNGSNCFVPFRDEFFADPDLEDQQLCLLVAWILE